MSNISKYDSLNNMQKEAVLHTEGPLLVLAGAGSGKTRVLTHRIAYLVEEKQVDPWNILAITFTNKAAGEMKERVMNIVDFGADSIWVSTFHSMCVRILRRHIERIGYDTNFTIYDTDDQKTVMRQVFKKLQIDTKFLKERTALSAISAAKNEMTTPQEMLANAGYDFSMKKTAEAYAEYQKELKKNNALDFDDLLLKTVELFEQNPDVLEYYQERFKYIMVDEYQDTNHVQFKLVAMMARKYKNLCVVGDDDQSIYKFRGADITNILGFEKVFPGARVIKLEQNYRSTKKILDAANEVIRNNKGRKNKTLWTDNADGAGIRYMQFNTATEEAETIAKEIRREVNGAAQSTRQYSDYAVLYRTNAQSRLLEERFIMSDIPYRLVGGVNFYQRKEIKDILCYLKTIDNGRDDLAVQRIINVPKRGIGATTVGKLTIYGSANNMSFYEACLRVKGIQGMGKAGDKIEKFTSQIEKFKLTARTKSIKDLIEQILNETGYKAELEEEGEIEAQTRLENIQELINKAVSYENKEDEPSLSGFLEDVALVAEVDAVDDSENRVVLMTLHSAKGLEFPVVYLSGMEDGLFPSMMSIMSDDRDAIEEERRLCYVGITRAMEKLTLTGARQRMTNGETRYGKTSRFVEEIPDWMLETESQPLKSWGSGDWGSSGKSGGSSGNSWGNSWGSRNDAGPGGSAGSWNNSWGAGKSSGSSVGFGKQVGAGTTAAGLRAGIFDKKKSPYAGGTSTGAAAGGGFGSKAVSAKPAFGKDFSVEKSDGLEYGVGDRIKHIRFGEGTVAEIVDGGRDYEVSVDFDKVGRKKMFASFAKLKKI